MQARVSQTFIEALTDKLAEIEHERWSHWQRYMHSRCERNPNGSLTLPSEYVEKWERQSDTPYQDLSESEKMSDRDQVRRYLPLVLNELGIEVDPPH